MLASSVADPGGRGAMPPPSPVKISHKNMVAEGGHRDFMFPPIWRLDPLLQLYNSNFYYDHLLDKRLDKLIQIPDHDFSSILTQRCR